MTLLEVEEVEEFPGRGIRAKVEGKRILCGNAQLLREHWIAADPGISAPGTQVLVAVEGKLVGFVTIADSLKSDAKTGVQRLKALGMTTAILTGDEQATADAVAAEVGIKQVYAKQLPQEKLENLRAIRKQAGAVMFVGDGINDAPVLAGADVGAAMGSGADAAIEAADVVFMTGSVEAIPDSIAIARDTARIAWQNVIFALAIKFLVMTLGLAGHASMWMAVFADSGVAMLCVLNSIRMLYRKK
jgi:Cd2+/Zn2+-exporting ATPase